MNPFRKTLLILALALTTTALTSGCISAPDATAAEADANADEAATPPDGTSQGARTSLASAPVEAGHAAFGAIQEIVGLLEADPDTDWSTVRLDVLREHLVDMDELTLNAIVVEKDVPGGVQATVTGTGRTVPALHRMVTTHAQMTLAGIAEWTVTTETMDHGVVLTVTAASEQEIAHVRGLGFFGLMATGADHPAHHLMMARGEMHGAHH